jgi:hypothetical protein
MTAGTGYSEQNDSIHGEDNDAVSIGHRILCLMPLQVMGTGKLISTEILRRSYDLGVLSSVGRPPARPQTTHSKR